MSYKEQFIWKRAVELAIHCYKFTNLFPKSELYGLTSQIRRSSVSVASNIAEGYGRRSRQEYIHFLHIALGSLRELDTQFIIAKEVDLTERKLLNPIMNEVEEMQSILVATLNKLKAKNPIKQK
ncbi:MAG: four helix bundle protein [Cyanobacteria bacterium P01_H01_bin.150]